MAASARALVIEIVVASDSTHHSACASRTKWRYAGAPRGAS